MKLTVSISSDRNPPLRFPWLWLFLLSAGLMLAAGMLIWLLQNRSPSVKAMPPSGSVLPVLHLSATPTPFTPLMNPATPEPEIYLHPQEETAVATTVPEPVVDVPPSFWQAFDFSDGAERVEIHLVDPDLGILGGKPVQMRFTPGSDCVFGSGKACVSLHADSRVMLLTIHSGISGEGQQLRHALEGTGINTAGLRTAEILANLDQLQGAIASLHQGVTNLDYLTVVAAIRIPPDQIDAYYDLPFLEAVDWAAEGNEDLHQRLADGQSLIFIETCGWPVIGEVSAGGEYQGTGSIYLIAIGK